VLAAGPQFVSHSSERVQCLTAGDKASNVDAVSVKFPCGAWSDDKLDHVQLASVD